MKGFSLRELFFSICIIETVKCAGLTNDIKHNMGVSFPFLMGVRGVMVVSLMQGDLVETLELMDSLVTGDLTGYRIPGDITGSWIPDIMGSRIPGDLMQSRVPENLRESRVPGDLIGSRVDGGFTFCWADLALEGSFVHGDSMGPRDIPVVLGETRVSGFLESGGL